MQLYIKQSQNEACSDHCIALLKEYLQKCLTAAPRFQSEAPQGFSLVYEKDDEEHADLYKTITKKDGFVLTSNNGTVFFLAKSPRGLLYATISYLEDVLGCRFFTSDDEYCPKLDSLPSFKTKTYNPVFTMRTYIVGGTYDDEMREGYVSPKLDDLAKTHTLDVFTRVDAAHGGPLPFYARNTSHNFHFYCPFEKYGKDHPEFFKAISVNNVPMHTIDITNGLLPDGRIDETMQVSVVKVVIEELKKDVLAHPEADYFSLTQEDGNDYFDDDHNRALEKIYKRSGLLVRFCNAVIRAIHPWAQKQLGRDIKLMTFAYDYAKEPPVKKVGESYVPLDPSLVCDENLIIQLAIDHNAFYSYFDPRQDAFVKATMEGWKAVARRFWFWGYDADFTNFCSYFDSFSTVMGNVLGLIDYGAEYVCFCASYDSYANWQCNLNGYLYHRLLWDPSLSQEDLTKEYLTHHYGPAADSVASLMELFHANYQQMIAAGNDLHLASWGSQTYPENNPLPMLLKALEILKSGEKALAKSHLAKEEKKILSTRLSAVKATPLCLLYLNYHSYYPQGDEVGRLAALEAFKKAAADGEILMGRERMSFQKFIDFTESSEYNVRPLWLNHHLCTPSIKPDGQAVYQ